MAVNASATRRVDVFGRPQPHYTKYKGIEESIALIAGRRCRPEPGSEFRPKSGLGLSSRPHVMCQRGFDRELDHAPPPRCILFGPSKPVKRIDRRAANKDSTAGPRQNPTRQAANSNSPRRAAGTMQSLDPERSVAFSRTPPWNDVSPSQRRRGKNTPCYRRPNASRRYKFAHYQLRTRAFYRRRRPRAVASDATNVPTPRASEEGSGIC